MLVETVLIMIGLLTLVLSLVAIIVYITTGEIP